MQKYSLTATLAMAKCRIKRSTCVGSDAEKAQKHPVKKHKASLRHHFSFSFRRERPVHCYAWVCSVLTNILVNEAFLGCLGELVTTSLRHVNYNSCCTCVDSDPLSSCMAIFGLVRTAQTTELKSQQSEHRKVKWIQCSKFRQKLFVLPKLKTYVPRWEHIMQCLHKKLKKHQLVQQLRKTVIASIRIRASILFMLSAVRPFQVFRVHWKTLLFFCFQFLSRGWADFFSGPVFVTHVTWRRSCSFRRIDSLLVKKGSKVVMLWGPHVFEQSYGFLGMS